MIVTSTQKMATLVRRREYTDQQHVVFIVDEAHRSTSGDMIKDIKKAFPHSAWVGYTGTPVFADVNLNNSRLGNNLATRTKALIATAKMVNDFDYFDENGHDILGDVYEYLIKQFASNAGKKAGEFYTPHEVSKVLAKLVAANMDLNQESFSIYDPTMGSGSLLLTVRDEIPNGRQKGRVRFYGQELNTTTYNLARMNLMMHGVDYGNMTLHNADTLAMDWPDGLDQDGVDRPHFFDAVVANPPYSQKWDADSSKLKDPRFKDYGALAPKHSGSLNNVDGDFKMYRNGNLKLYNYGMKKLQGR